MKFEVKNQLAKEPKLWIVKLISTLVVLALIIWSANSLEYHGIKYTGVSIAKNILIGLISPSKELLFNFGTNGVLYLLLQTVAIAVLGTIIGSIISVPFAFMCSANIVPKWISTLGTIIVAAIRTIPAFVYGLMFIRVTGPGAFAGVLTIGIVSIGMMTKLYIEAIEDLDRNIIESLDVAGCNLAQKVRYGILPQLSTNFVSTAIYRFEINLKDATILGLVGAGGIGAPLIFAMNAYRWKEVGAILIGLAVLVLIVEYCSTKIRAKLATGI
ncbi:phosphonate ABC transporter, inner membrane subunit [Clostridium sp. DL-VIII]|uniref:phosphonate ABC transporter, permease protein PhnE n=1 Tax=Clostridium sp. DL-VIII TaxID=641107 RepID=UPI00023B07F9|nr:phosphonate ABC transporter, permease protein PhnE [Clostridium sp. DL-VIII]EHJ02178.1 phosphonate ABC transporter, inner membrane subunit [Clostridium sp. DL-VIII]